METEEKSVIRYFQSTLEALNINEVFRYRPNIANRAAHFCSDNSILQKICPFVMSQLFGYPEQMNKVGCSFTITNGGNGSQLFIVFIDIIELYFSFLFQTIFPIIFDHSPAGGSVKTLRHFLQNINSGKKFSNI